MLLDSGFLKADFSVFMVLSDTLITGRTEGSSPNSLSGHVRMVE